MVVGIKNYSYELGELYPVDSYEDIKFVPQCNNRSLLDMIKNCCSRIPVHPDVVYIAHSLPFVRSENDDTLSEHLGAPVFWLSGMPCAVMHNAAKLAVLQINKGRYKTVLVIGADKAYSDRERRFWNTIMGDAVVALLLSESADNCILSTYLNTQLYAVRGENSNEELVKAYRETLPLLLRNAFEKCLIIADISMVDYIAPHTPNRKLWDSFSAITGFERSKILDSGITCTGHFNSHDSFYHYLKNCEDGIIKQGETAMLINPGFGGTQACTIIRR